MKIGVLNRHQEIRTLWFKIGVIYVNARTLWFSRICSKIYPKFLPKFLLKFLQKDYLGFLLESITEFLLEKHSGFLNIYPLLQISSWDSFQNWFRDSSRNLFLDSLRNSFLDFSCTSPVFLEFLFTICRGFPSKFFFRGLSLNSSRDCTGNLVFLLIFLLEFLPHTGLFQLESL